MANAPMVPVSSTDELRRFLEAGGRPVARHRVGLEHEKIGVLSDGRPLPYDTAIAPLLEALAAGGRWSRVEESGRIIGLRREGATVSLEPGGQFEFSDAPQPSAAAAAAALDAHLLELAEPSRALGITWLAAGFRPLGTLDDVPWMPKGRYAVMRAYLPTRGRLGHEMMKRTATVQANLDWADPADCADRMRTAMGVSSIVTALWASSSIVDGKQSGYQSYRAACWLDCDPDRCGLLPFVFDADAPDVLLHKYTEWALDVPLFFLHRGGAYRDSHGATFRRFLVEGIDGERATMGDWEVHLSTLFPEVRLRPHLEVRSADAGTRGMVKALPALYRGILDDAQGRRAAWQLVSAWSMAERERLRQEVPRAGLATRAPGTATTLLELGRELVAIARAGVTRLGDDPSLLDAVEEVATTGRSRADRLAVAPLDLLTDLPFILKT